MKYFKILSLFTTLLLVILSVDAQVKVPRFVSDSMVLQRNTAIPIWGWAAPGEKVTITFNNKKYETVTGSDKKWSVKLDKMNAGGPYTLQIDASNHLEIKGILIGDVWIASGQSNMDFRMYQAKDKYAKEIANSTNTNIRQFLVYKRYYFPSTLDDVRSVDGWQSANPVNTLQFTAVGYFFAKNIYDKYKVPIGIIHTSWGGTPAQSWVSEETIKKFPDYYNELQQWKDTTKVMNTVRSERNRSTGWYNFLSQNDTGLLSSPKWYENASQYDGWKTMQVPGYWENKGIPNLDGVVWFKNEIEIPASLAGQKATLFLGNIADEDSTYINGIKVGNISSKYLPRKYEINPGVLHTGKNIITVRVLNKWGPGGFIEDKPYYLSFGSTNIDLKGTWYAKAGIAARAALQGNTNFHYKPTGLFNAMVAALIPYAIKGAIWYQGEANTAKGKEYQELFPSLIKNWREEWHQGDFPFLFVQLANYLPTKSEPGQSDWAELREAQTMTLSLPNTGMAVISDIGEWNDVHPLDKEDVGKRLSLAAEKVAYGEKNVVYSSPLFKSVSFDGNKATISFNLFGSRLVAKGADTLSQFAIAGADKKFVWAHAIIKGDKVIVWKEQIEHPVAVRYAWADNPEGANLYNREGLPASSFRTDKDQ